MRIYFTLLVLFFSIQSKNSFAIRKTPLEYPQTSWEYTQVVYRKVSYSMTAEKEKEAADPFGRNDNYNPNRVKEQSNFSHNFKVYGGWGLGFSLEVPHRKWLNFGLFIGIYANSPKSGVEGLFKGYKSTRFATRILFFPRFQYPMNFGFLTLNPYLKMGVGIGGGIEIWETDKDNNAGAVAGPFLFPASFTGGVDLYLGKWFALTTAAQFTIAPGFDVVQSSTKQSSPKGKTVGIPTVFNQEFAMIFGFKSTYL